MVSPLNGLEQLPYWLSVLTLESRQEGIALVGNFSGVLQDLASLVVHADASFVGAMMGGMPITRPEY
jgi:hypothetical protein